jgi:peptide/nickel transport system permease protein
VKRFRFISLRIVQGLLILLLVSIINFFLIRAAPGDPAAVMAGEAGAADELFLEQLRIQFGLDKPLPVQLGNYLAHVLQFDLGFSYRQQQPVLDLILQRLPATLLLTGSAFIVSLVVGIFLGVLASRRPGSLVDNAITLMSLIFYATPMYWLALMAILLFSIQLGWLPAFGFSTVGAQLQGLPWALDILSHLVLPTLALSVFYIAIYTRMTRASMLEVSHMAFVKTARAKGLTPRRITRAHILRNALLPVVTLAGIQAGNMVGGAVLTETVFAWPGIGRLMFESLLQRDYNLLLGTFLFTAAMAIAFNILTDLAYTLVNPSIEMT